MFFSKKSDEVIFAIFENLIRDFVTTAMKKAKIALQIRTRRP